MSLAPPEKPLTDGVVVIRRWSQDDLPCVAEAALDPRIPEMTTVPSAYDDEAGLAWIERQWSREEQGDALSLAIADAAGGVARGSAALLLRPGAEGAAGIGYWLAPSARGAGRATRAVALLAGWALADLGLARVEALVEPENLASQRVLERVGFRREALLRSYLAFPTRRADALVYARLRD